MATRPPFIDIRSQSQGPSISGLPSPRIAHVDGDIPPELSPLDAFAAQGRLLAKQLDEGQKNGRRISRLPPQTIERSLTQARPSVFRSVSADSEVSTDAALSRPRREEHGSGSRTELAVPNFRPKSVHPRMSGIVLPPFAPGSRANPPPALPPSSLGQTPDTPASMSGWRPGAPRARSPEAFLRSPTDARGRDDNGYLDARRQRSFEVARQPDLARRAGSPEVFSRQLRDNTGSLVPPRSPFGRSGSSIRSVPADASDEEARASIDDHGASLRRELSGESFISPPSPPRSPFALPRPPRSPSISSEYSVNGTRQPRGLTNFSRPISRASRPSLDMPSRQASTDSAPFYNAEETLSTPVSMDGEDGEPHDANHPPVPYIYSTFSLPRGRTLQKQSQIPPDANPQHHYQWETPPVPYSNVSAASSPRTDRPPSPPHEDPIPTLSPDKKKRTHVPHQSPKARNVTPKLPPTQAMPSPRPSEESQSGATSISSNGTIRPTTARAPGASSRELSAEDHLSKGIRCHEEGSLNESTYHLRIAAKANHPTAMLLYALACRHGWGMRPNQREGVQWLRKAADFASLEIAEDADRDESPNDVLERKTRRAQFALSIYELGMSHMNGWGIEVDKVLALRCFEIAGSWGDGDALSEAGFCYAQGVGCKKDLKKSAWLYRQAEVKGISMVGNSWIHKPKYKDGYDDEQLTAQKSASASASASARGRTAGNDKKDNTDGDVNNKKKPRDKSRTRTIFARKKSFASP
ncbi:MAG: hypothetical protein M1825_002954 [Sarcosagium campestre]|nr:MAG: hypothetical protein M1825_002954 [Sarcosagium campestre]